MEKLLNIIKKFIPTRIFKKFQPVYHLVLAWLAAFWYRWPSEKLIVVGVTGTTGKTTSVHLIAKTLEHAGYRVGYTSTAMFKVGEKEWLNDKKMTMLGRFFIQRMLRKMVKAGCQYAIVETTSQGIEQFRHRFINYDILVFTGLYPEHIEAHGSFANYKKAKGKLFAYLSTCQPKYVDEQKRVVKIKNELKKIHSERVKKVIIANGDDEHAEYFLDHKADEKYEFRMQNSECRIQNAECRMQNSECRIQNAEFRMQNSECRMQNAEIRNKDGEIQEVIVSDVDVDVQGIHFEVDGIKFDLQLMGEFNVHNALAAVSVGLSQELTLEQIKAGLESVSGVPGRFERITLTPSSQGGQATLPPARRGGAKEDKLDFTVIVDYAFEPRAVEKLYETIELIPHRRVIHVLGSAGGGRDVARRPILGKLAGEKADVVIVTNEDPYDDDSQIIIDQVALGAESVQASQGGQEKNLFKILDRREAIRKALQIAEAGDVVLITGKGCEQAICVEGGKKIPWDDRKVVREELQRIKN